jgi:Mrp family chromosome partitioning ATPase
MRKKRERTPLGIEPHRIETYRILQIAMELLINEQNFKIVAFSSLSYAEDKFRHVVSVARLMAKEGKRILLLEFNSDDPEVKKLIGNIGGNTGDNIDGNTGDNIDGNTGDNIDGNTGEGTDGNAGFPGLHVVVKGQKMGDTVKELSISNIGGILEVVREKYDLILIDAPPVGYSADGIKLCSIADGTILIMRAGKAPVQLAVRSKEMLDTVEARVMGVILEK